MPGSITHLAYIDKYLKKNPVKDFKRFVLGTTFPDIRYFAKVDRNLTHKRFSPDFNFSGFNSFETGWKLHIWLDNRWNSLVKNSEFYDRYQNDKMIASVAAKIIEDALDYKKIVEPKKYLAILRDAGLESILEIPMEKIRQYYLASADYMVTKDFKKFIRHFFSEETIEKVESKINEIKKDKEAMNFLAGILDRLIP